MSTKAPSPGQTRPILRVLIALVLVALLIAFIVENTQRVRIHFIVFTLTTSLVWALFVSGALGLIIGLIVPYASRRLRKR